MTPVAKNTRADLRRVVAQIRDLTVRRDELVRQGIAEKVRVADLAEDADLSIARIYQIRDGRR